MPSRSEHLTFGSLSICGISTSCILLATGIACLIISLTQIIRTDIHDNSNSDNDNDNNNDGTNTNGGGNGIIVKPNCGLNGKPPLLDWVFGTGISFMIITCAFCRISSGKKVGTLVKLILAVSNLFILLWGVVGIFSVFVHGVDCKTMNPALYRMGVSGVCISFIICCCGGFVGYKQQYSTMDDIPVAEAVEVVHVEEVDTNNDDDKDNVNSENNENEENHV